MPVLSDFTTIIGDSPKTVTLTASDIEFNTGGREAGSSEVGTKGAVIIFSVQGLNASNTVKVNGTAIGNLSPNPDQSNWFMQTISLPGNILKDGDNKLRLEANATDNSFKVKNVICFFHQDA